MLHDGRPVLVASGGRLLRRLLTPCPPLPGSGSVHADSPPSSTCNPRKLLRASRRRTAPQAPGPAAAASSACCSLTQNTAVVSSLPMPRKVRPRTLKTGTPNRLWLVSSTSGSVMAQRRMPSVAVTIAAGTDSVPPRFSAVRQRRADSGTAYNPVGHVSRPVGARLPSGWRRVAVTPTVAGQTAGGRPVMHRQRERERPVLPHRVRHLGGDADRWSRRRG